MDDRDNEVSDFDNTPDEASMDNDIDNDSDSSFKGGSDQAISSEYLLHRINEIGVKYFKL